MVGQVKKAVKQWIIRLSAYSAAIWLKLLTGPAPTWSSVTIADAKRNLCYTEKI